MYARRFLAYFVVPTLLVGGLVVPSAASVQAASGPDFDGDGFADLAIGAPTKDHGANGSGTVSVLYGGQDALSRHGDQLWSEDVPGIHDETEDFDAFGQALSWGDLDGDGFDDLVIGVPGENAGAIRAGAVHVLFGSPAGLTVDRAQYWHQGIAGVLGKADQDDSFGEALAIGDFDSDGFDDLAVGVPREASGTGEVAAFPGSPTGLSAATDERWTQAADEYEVGDLFGLALVTGDVDGDGHDDLAIGAPYEDVGPQPNAGAVTVLRGSPDGLTDVGRQVWSQDSTGVLGSAVAGDQFGSALSSGDANGDGFTDLAIGVTHDQVDGVGVAGAAALLLGSADALTAEGDQLWSQDSPGVPGRAEPAERVQDVLLADLDSDGFEELVIGFPFEFVDGLSIAGVTLVLPGSTDGATAAGARQWTQDSRGVRDQVEEYDTFGTALAGGDYDGDGVGDLVVGAPAEHVPPDDVQGGALTLLLGSPSGLTGRGDQFWSMDSRGIVGTADHLDAFGSVLASG